MDMFSLKLPLAKFSTVSFLVSLALVNIAPVRGQTSAGQYPQELVRQYLTSCQQRSLSEGLSSSQAEQLCKCTIKEFQARYSLEEFRKLTEEARTKPEAADALGEVGYICFEQTLV